MTQLPRNHACPRAGPTSFSELPRVVDRAAVLPRRLGLQAAPSESNGATGDPGDLVARALAILADDAERRQKRSNANVPRRSLR